MILGKGGLLKIHNSRYLPNLKKAYRILKSPSIKKQLSIFLMGLIMNFIYSPSLYWILKKIYKKFISIGLIPSNFEPIKFSLKEKPIQDIQKLGILQKLFLKIAIFNYERKRGVRIKGKKYLDE